MLTEHGSEPLLVRKLFSSRCGRYAAASAAFADSLVAMMFPSSAGIAALSPGLWGVRQRINIFSMVGRFASGANLKDCCKKRGSLGESPQSKEQGAKIFCRKGESVIEAQRQTKAALGIGKLSKRSLHRSPIVPQLTSGTLRDGIGEELRGFLKLP